MPKPTNSLLVLDGETVKLRLLAERQETKHLVHVDWVRFTTHVRNAEWPKADSAVGEYWETVHFDCMSNRQKLDRVSRGTMKFDDSDFFVSAQAFELAKQTAECLGAAFQVEPDPLKGMDFYKFRWSITLNGSEVAWVGFLSSSDSPRQRSQADTIHVNIMGTGCTFADSGWRLRLADVIDQCEAVLTRADLALDFFDGYEGGIDSIRTDYRNGLCNVGGRKLKFNMVGDWENGHERSVYLGSREAGKVTNVYEKGDQLFGVKANSDWMRFELRYGNKLRVLSSDMLRRPDDFFAGASDWHQSVLRKAQGVFSAQKVPCNQRLPIETIQAECVRNLRWVRDTAAASFAVLVDAIDQENLWEILGHTKLPGRLRKFSLTQIRQTMGASFERLKTEISTAVPSPGAYQVAI
jgi:phage replication initiation protein